LSGSPYDVVNPNGLAAIICTVLLFLYYLAGLSWINTLAFLALAPACLYALALTGSRSGFVTLIVILAVIVLKSRHRFLVGAAGVLVIVAGFQFLSADQQDRYLSVFGAGEKNLETADQRFDSMEADFLVAMRRPVLGHGLGTSQEANANFGGRNQPSHNLYLEVVQELGLIGLAIFLLFLKSILTASVQLRRAYADADAAKFPLRLVDALQVWLWMNLIFSLASYGLSVYEWYLMGGLLLVMRRFAVTPRGNVAQGATM
jgi:O-antigen ligase